MLDRSQVRQRVRNKDRYVRRSPFGRVTYVTKPKLFRGVHEHVYREVLTTQEFQHGLRHLEGTE